MSSLNDKFTATVTAEPHLVFEGFPTGATREEILERLAESLDLVALQGILAEMAVESSAQAMIEAFSILASQGLDDRQRLIHRGYCFWLEDGELLFQKMPSPQFEHLFNPPYRIADTA